MIRQVPKNGGSRLDLLAAAGANSVRTWGHEQTEKIIDEAGRLGLTAARMAPPPADGCVLIIADGRNRAARGTS